MKVPEIRTGENLILVFQPRQEKDQLLLQLLIEVPVPYRNVIVSFGVETDLIVKAKYDQNI